MNFGIAKIFNASDKQAQDKFNYLIDLLSKNSISIDASIENAKSDIAQILMPIGTIVTLGVSTNPDILYGFGTWTAIESRTIISKGADFTLYSDGWCEQYGTITTNDGSDTLIAFPKLFIDTSYYIVGSTVTNVGQDPYRNGWAIHAKNIDYFYVENKTNGTNTFNWTAFGYSYIPTGGNRYKWERTA